MTKEVRLSRNKLWLYWELRNEQTGISRKDGKEGRREPAEEQGREKTRRKVIKESKKETKRGNKKEIWMEQRKQTRKSEGRRKKPGENESYKMEKMEQLD